MRTFAIAVILSVAGACMGQQPNPSAKHKPLVACLSTGAPCVGQQPDPRPACTPALTGAVMEGTRCNGELWVTVKPAPLKCGKYEHFEAAVTVNDPSVCFDCFKSLPDRCVPDLHTVTEKEWQELMARLNKLESK